MSHQRANSTSFVPNAFGGVGPNTTIDMPPSDPLSISNPRQRSFSSSFSLATSPRTFTGSSIISNPSNPLLGYGPASPTSAAPSSFGGSSSATQTMPVLHRRFSSSFNQLNQIVSPPTAGVQAETPGGLFRKFSTGRSSHPFDRNETDPAGGLAPQPNLATSGGGNGPVGGTHLTAVEKLKPPHDNRHSRSNSPMRSLILGGQMLD
ncbi:hypothetical protein BG006_003101 [Podila minutissima]|uniref:Uncharacterized protein n=1 Tax=Podila minutissima TaxID=64525 RepID=A0A9P5SX70_9FUNG|nr:hypothetical protein BG006_003101 [Podila minutissima]